MTPFSMLGSRSVSTRGPTTSMPGFPPTIRPPRSPVASRWSPRPARSFAANRGRRGGLDTAFQNGWEDVDYCLRAGEAGYEVHYCAESVVYHFESATRNLVSDAERANQDP